MVSPRNVLWQACLAACFSFFLSSAVLAGDPSSSGQESDGHVFRFNVSPNGYPPYLITENGQASGIMWAVVSEIGSRLGYRVETRQFPHKRVEQMLKQDILDGTARAMEWTEKPGDFVFTDPIVNAEEVIFFPTSSSYDFEVVEDLFSLTLVTHLGYIYPKLEPYFESEKIKRFDVTGDRNIFLYASRGDGLDAAVADRLVGQWILKQEGMTDQFRVSSATLQEVGYRIMLRPGLETFAEAFNRELTTMRSSGELENIISKYR